MNVLSAPPPTITAQFESEPPGAEARTSTGQSCRTPCALALPAQGFNVTFTLNGYLPQAIPVVLHVPEFRPDPELGDTLPSFRPNPVVAALELAPPPPRKKKRRRKRKKRPVAARAPARAPVQRPAPASAAPPPAAAPAPASPWPATR